ncbi:hypothetical protein C7B67_16450 [filamentous cyanobacterium Phorm 6]|nr:hypothetical protein C7B67_16450 [filamentous cyanobacterium Phorm 6]
MNWQNQANLNFLGICFSGGLLASNLAWANPDYFWLCVVFLICVALWLFFYPSEPKFQRLWRFGGLILIVGAIANNWEMLAKFSQLQIFGGIAGIILIGFAGIFAVGAVGGGK